MRDAGMSKRGDAGMSKGRRFRKEKKRKENGRKRKNEGKKEMQRKERKKEEKERKEGKGDVGRLDLAGGGRSWPELAGVGGQGPKREG